MSSVRKGNGKASAMVTPCIHCENDHLLNQGAAPIRSKHKHGMEITAARMISHHRFVPGRQYTDPDVHDIDQHCHFSLDTWQDQASHTHLAGLHIVDCSSS